LESPGARRCLRAVSPKVTTCDNLDWLVVYLPQLGLLFPVHGKITNVPNHQPVMVYKFSYTKLYPWKTIPTASQNVALTLLSIPWMGMGIPWGGPCFFGYNGRYNEFNESHKHV
jgi:hypothetical protein